MLGKCLIHLSTVSRDWRNAAYVTPMLQMCRLAVGMQESQLKRSLAAISRWQNLREANGTDKEDQLILFRNNLVQHDCFAIAAPLLSMLQSGEMISRSREPGDQSGTVRFRFRLPDESTTSSKSIHRTSPAMLQELQVTWKNFDFYEASNFWRVLLPSGQRLMHFEEMVGRDGETDPIQYDALPLAKWMQERRLLYGEPLLQLRLLIGTIEFLFQWAHHHSPIGDSLRDENRGGGACARAIGCRFPTRANVKPMAQDFRQHYGGHTTAASHSAMNEPSKMSMSDSDEENSDEEDD